MYVIKSHSKKKNEQTKKLKDEKRSKNELNEWNRANELMLSDEVFQIGWMGECEWRQNGEQIANRDSRWMRSGCTTSDGDDKEDDERNQVHEYLRPILLQKSLRNVYAEIAMSSLLDIPYNKLGRLAQRSVDAFRVSRAVDTGYGYKMITTLVDARNIRLV